MIDFVQKGGLLLWPIFLLSIFAFAIFLERWFYYHRVSICVGEFLQGLANLIRHRSYSEAFHECAATPGPVARVVHTALLHHDRQRVELKEIVQESAQLEIPALEKNLGALSAIAQIAPLLGLLGTVLGMLDTFTQLSLHSGYVMANDLSFGIYKSLLTSAAGLAVTIPTLAAYAYLSSRVNCLIHDMERAGIEIVSLLTEKTSSATDIIPFNQPSPAVKERYNGLR